MATRWGQVETKYGQRGVLDVPNGDGVTVTQHFEDAGLCRGGTPACSRVVVVGKNKHPAHYRDEEG